MKARTLHGNEVKLTEEVLHRESVLEVGAGVYLWTREGIIKEQASWDPEDPAKKEDFSDYPYWLEAIPGGITGYDTLQDVAKEFAKNDKRRR